MLIFYSMLLLSTITLNITFPAVKPSVAWANALNGKLG
jgi:hypothetical protein